MDLIMCLHRIKIVAGGKLNYKTYTPYGEGNVIQSREVNKIMAYLLTWE